MTLNLPSRVFHAGTSEMFGSGHSGYITEESPFKPMSPYAVAKVSSSYIADYYRRVMGVDIWVALTFNHESALRGDDFFTKKVCKGVAKWKAGCGRTIEVGNLDFVRDWGAAEEYV